MDMYSLVSIIGGLAFFLFGMNIMSSGLKKVAGDRLESVLQKMTDSPIKGLIFGAVITIAMQSSSALTVMLVGLVNSGIMSLLQTVGIIMGSNLGTTLTAWLLSLSGVKTDNPFLLMMKPEYFSPIIALIGVLLIMGGKKQKHKDVGCIISTCRDAGIYKYTYGVQKPVFGSADRYYIYRRYPVVSCFCWRAAGAEFDGAYNIWSSDTDHHGPEHWNLCYGADFFIWCKQKC